MTSLRPFRFCEVDVHNFGMVRHSGSPCYDADRNAAFSCIPSGDLRCRLLDVSYAWCFPDFCRSWPTLQALAQDKSVASGAFSFDKAPMHVANNNAQVRMMVRGKLATGEGIEVHQTTLPPGGAPTATTHHHPHSEMWLIREGTIDLTVNGKNFRLEPGSVGFVASNEEHGVGKVLAPRQPCISWSRSDRARSCKSKPSIR